MYLGLSILNLALIGRGHRAAGTHIATKLRLIPLEERQMPLNPTEGHIIAGTMIDDHRFVGRVRAAQLFQIAPDPRDTENKKKLDASKELQDLRGVREEVQRLFEGAKKKNVQPYSEYIIGLAHGEDGITPVITLYS